MNTLRIFVVSLLLLFTASSLKNEVRAQSYSNLSYQDFYDDLAPYGEWLYDDQYGYVWLPDVGSDFRPYYTNGYWAYTDYGNTWISNYDWGWAPFHYGRWTYDGYYGWLWIPGTEWAPAWVSWRSTNDYYGWAPMGPGISINVNLNLIPMDWWMFISPNYMYDRSFYRYCNNDWGFRRNVYRRTQIINYTYVDNRTVYYCGPRSDDYYRRTGVRPSMFRVNPSNRPGNTRIAAGNRVNIYRPEIRQAPHARPAQPMRIDRGISRRPESFGGSMEQASGRMQILRQSSRYQNSDPSLRRPDMRNDGQRESYRNEQPAAPGRERMNQDPNRYNQNMDRRRFSSEQQQPTSPQSEPRRDFQNIQREQNRQQEMQQRMQQNADQQRAVREQEMQQQRRQQEMQQRMQQNADQQRAAREQQMGQQRRQQEMQQRMQQNADQQRAVREQQMDQQRRQQEMQQRMQQNADQQRAVREQQMDQQRRQQEMQQRMQQNAGQQSPRSFQRQENQPQQERREARPAEPQRGGMRGFRDNR